MTKECPKCKEQYAADVAVCPDCKRLLHEPGVDPKKADTIPREMQATLVKTFRKGGGTTGGGSGEDNPPLEPGTVIGSYRLEELIGKGGMGEVYAATHTTLGRRFALKLLRNSTKWQREAVQRFYLEARAASQVQHPNIVSITDFIESEEGEFCYVMEYLEGEPLDRLVKQGAPPLVDTLEISAQIAEGLEALHEAGVIHRDLKPGNVFLVKREGQGVQVKLLDFGIIKLSEESELPEADFKATAQMRIMGTPDYMSPEQITAPDLLDRRTDIYSLGVIMYELVTGRRPIMGISLEHMLHNVVNFQPITPSDAVGAPVTRPLEQLIMRCLAKDPGERPARASDVAAVLRQGQAALEVARQPPPPEPKPRPRTDRRLLLLVLLLWAVVAFGAVRAIFWKGPKEATGPPPTAAATQEAPIATLARMWNEVSRRPRQGTDFAAAREKMDLYRLDAVKTGAGAGAEVRFRSGAVMSVGERSVVLIEEHDPKGPASGPVARLSAGALRGELKGGKTLHLYTPAGRLVKLTPEGEGPVKYRITTREDGSVEVALLGGRARVRTSSKEVGLTHGEATDVLLDEPGAPVKLPAFPELQEPGPDRTVTGPEVAFVWSEADGAASYRLQIGQGTVFQDLVEDRYLELNTLVTEELPPGKYSWRVAGVDDSGREGEFGFARRFTVAASTGADAGPGDPGDAGAAAPAKAAFRASPSRGRKYRTASTLSVAFRWSGGTPPYRLVLSRRVSLKPPIAAIRQLPGPSVTIKRLSPGTYYWQLFSGDDDSTPRPLMRPRRLVIEQLKPPRLEVPGIKWGTKK